MGRCVFLCVFKRLAFICRLAFTIINKKNAANHQFINIINTATCAFVAIAWFVVVLFACSEPAPVSPASALILTPFYSLSKAYLP